MEEKKTDAEGWCSDVVDKDLRIMILPEWIDELIREQPGESSNNNNQQQTSRKTTTNNNNIQLEHILEHYSLATKI